MKQTQATKTLIDVAARVLLMLQRDELHGPGRKTGIVSDLSEAISCARRDSERPEPGVEPPAPVCVPVEDLNELPLNMDAYERACVLRALRANQGNRLAAAFALGVGKSTLYRKIRLHGIDESETGSS